MTDTSSDGSTVRTGFTAENTAVTLRLACDATGLDSTDARLMRLGSNAVYRLAAPIVARIGPQAGIKEARKAVAVARWLASVDYPAVRALDVAQPVLADGRVVTFWEAVSDDGCPFRRNAASVRCAELRVGM